MYEIRRVATVALVVVVLLAGCSGGLGGGPGGEDATSPTTRDAAGTAETGTLAFYVSDRPAAIGDFASLTVTVTEIGVHRVGADGADDGRDDGDGGDEDETASKTTSAAPVVETTTAADGTPTPAPDGNESETPTATTPSTNEGAEATEDGNESDDGDASDAGWITVAVDEARVDLTELQGANATRIANASLPAGEYNGVYVEVSNVTGTLASGETVAVKLPSSRLRLNKGFTLGVGGSTSFVFDIAVHEAGGSGKYVLRPVIGESGTDVPIEDVDTKRSSKSKKSVTGASTGSAGADISNGSADGELDAKLTGPVTAGREVTLHVSRGNAPASNATVVVNGETVGSTGADGRLVVDVPDADVLSVVVRDGGDAVEVERTIR